MRMFLQKIISTNFDLITLSVDTINVLSFTLFSSDLDAMRCTPNFLPEKFETLHTTICLMNA